MVLIKEVINSQQIKYWFTSVSFDETNLPSSHSAGTTLKELSWDWWEKLLHLLQLNFTTTSPWNSQTSTITGTDGVKLLYLMELIITLLTIVDFYQLWS